ncbi:hypothetical protein QA612_13455 [Evansella sp. AB-P1]|uniref:hypothetical protein n=1 Tax=Evansella sp. AB-P1 TaxID=3037653 RepID=UPI00241CABC3|nr:hypothetical protein [Evansella sp. AB-P1]MDG5788489.1 hypothetical protein [Evansella sp. AB-P1]
MPLSTLEPTEFIRVEVQAKKEIEKTLESGRGIANSGLILSIVGLVFQIILIVLGIMTIFNEPVA